MSALTDYLAREQADRFILAELRDLSGVLQHRWSTRAYHLEAGDDADIRPFEPVIPADGVPSIRRQLQSYLSSGSALGYGNLKVLRCDPNNRPKIGWSVKLWVTGPRRLFPYADRIVMLDATVQRVEENDAGDVMLELVSARLEGLNAQVQRRTATSVTIFDDGTPVGTRTVYGDEPHPMGVVRNITPVVRDAANLQYAFSHEPAAGIGANPCTIDLNQVSAVYDSGVLIDPANYSLSFEGAIPNKVATLTLNSPPLGPLTMDLVGVRFNDEANSCRTTTTVRDLLTYVLTQFCGYVEAEIDINGSTGFAGDPDIFDFECGYFASPTVIARDLIHELVIGAGGCWWLGRDGRFYARPLRILVPPNTYPNAINRHERLRDMRWEQVGKPVNELPLIYDTNWTPIQPASGVAVADREKFSEPGFQLVIDAQNPDAGARPIDEPLISRLTVADESALAGARLVKELERQHIQVNLEIAFQGVALGLGLSVLDTICPATVFLVTELEDRFDGIPVHAVTGIGVAA